MKVILLLTCSFVVLFSHSPTVQGQALTLAGKGNSQVLRAYNARSIVIGQVIYIGEPSSARFSTLPLGTQDVVYKVIEVVKGDLKEEMINVAVEVSLSKVGDLKSVITAGQRHILLLNQKLDVECLAPVLDRNTNRYKSDREFEKYLKLSCYQLEADSIIAADAEEVKAMRSLFRASQSSRASSLSER